MKQNKIVLKGLIAVLLVLTFGTVAMGGFDPGSLNDGETITGPVLWAVGVMKENVGGVTGTLRIKQIDAQSCIVTTQALDQTSLDIPQGGTLLNLPTSENDLLGVRFQAGQVLGNPCQAVITKVKNFLAEGNFVSFDCQMKFIDDGQCSASGTQ